MSTGAVEKVGMEASGEFEGVSLGLSINTLAAVKAPAISKGPRVGEILKRVVEGKGEGGPPSVKFVAGSEALEGDGAMPKSLFWERSGVAAWLAMDAQTLSRRWLGS